MFRLRVLCVAMLALAMTAVLAVPAGAAVPASPSAKFCAATAKIGAASNGNSPTQAEAAKTYKAFKTAGKYAPPKVKAAANKIASVLSKIATIKPSNASDLAKLYTSTDFKAYGKAVATYFKYAATCSSS
jgi:hypothetical protein